MDSQSRLLAELTIGKILFVVMLLGATWMMLRWVRASLERLTSNNARLRFLLRQVEPPLRIMLWFGALLVAAQILAPSQDAFLAALGSAALAIGLGLQDLIKNLIGGLVVVADRPFQAGDRVRIGDAYGEVVQIGLRSTKIQGPNGVLVTVPNSDVLTHVIVNANVGVAESMVTVHLAVPFGTDPDQLIGIGREVAVSCPYTHLGHPVEVELSDKGPSSHFMGLSIAAYVYDHRYEVAMQTDLLRRAKREFLSAGLLRSPEKNRD